MTTQFFIPGVTLVKPVNLRKRSVPNTDTLVRSYPRGRHAAPKRFTDMPSVAPMDYRWPIQVGACGLHCAHGICSAQQASDLADEQTMARI